MSDYKIHISKDERKIRQLPYLVRWYGEYDPTIGKQKRYSKSFAKRKDAEQFIEELKKDFDSGMKRDQSEITLKELCNKFIATKTHILSRLSIDGYQNTIGQLLNHFCPTTHISKIRQEDAEQFIGQLTFTKPELLKTGSDISDSTRSRHLRNCKKVFQTALDWGYVRRNVFTPITAGKVRKRVWHYVSPEEFNSLVEKTTDLRNKALYTIMYYCGLRVAEALNLLWDGINIDFANNRVVIVNRPPTRDLPPFNIKDHEERSIPMPKIVVDALTQLHEGSETGNPFIFLTKERYERITARWEEVWQDGKARDWISGDVQNNTLRDFKKRCKDAGIKTNEKFNLHCLRKSYATNLANAGVPAHTLMKLMGHSSIVTSQKYYLHSSDANEKKAVEALEKISVGESSQEQG
jgi:integrase